jgi:hypothetical protein
MSDESVPSAKLAALTVDRLIQSGFLRADRRDALIADIAAGIMKGDDWKVEIELASAKAASE